MAKELPYFKFEPNQWENGNIQMLTREDKGLFIDLCSMYWSRLGNLPYKLALQKLCNGNATALNPLCEEEIITVIDGLICIEFLNEQLSEFEDKSEQNRKNARAGWEKRRKTKKTSDRNATALNSQSESDAIREEKIREEKIKEEEKQNREIPTLEEFIQHAKEKKPNVSLEAVRLKYEAWKDAGWVNGKNKKIKNWKSSLTNTINYLPEEKSKLRYY